MTKSHKELCDMMRFRRLALNIDATEGGGGTSIFRMSQKQNKIGGPCDPFALYAETISVNGSGKMDQKEGVLFYSQTIIAPAGNDFAFTEVQVPAGYRLNLIAIAFDTNDASHVSFTSPSFTAAPWFFSFMAPSGSSLTLDTTSSLTEPNFTASVPSIQLFANTQNGGFQESSITSDLHVPLAVIPGGFSIFAFVRQMTAAQFGRLTLYGVLVKDATVEENRGDYL